MQNLGKSEFTKYLIEKNSPALQDFREWIFYPGMLFNSLDKWWDSAKRKNPHEGLDLCFYKDQQNRICRLDEKTMIPAAFDGVITGIIDDFLGKSIINVHNTSGQTGSFCTIFGHVIPVNGIAAGSPINKGDVIATLASTGKSKAKIHPHLHITLGRLSDELFHGGLSWNNISDPKIFILQNPILLINMDYQVLNNI